MDYLSDMVARINNGQQRKRLSIEVLNSKFCSGVLDCLTREGFLRGYKNNGRTLTVYLKYRNDRPVIENCQRVSKQSKRVYYGASTLRKNYFNNELIVFSSNKGIFLNSQLVLSKLNEGGEALFKIN